MIRRPVFLAGLGLGLVATVWVIRAATLSAIPAVVSPDCGARLAMIQSFLSGGSLVRATGPEELHPFGFYLATLPSGTFLLYPPLFPLLSAAGYRLAGFPGLLVVPLLAGLLASAVTAVAGRQFGLAAWPALGPVTGLATALCFYSVTFWDPALLVLCAALAAFGMARGDARGGAIAGAAFGAGAFLHETAILLGAAVVAAGLPYRATRRPSVAALAAFGAGLVAWGATNVVLYGHPGGAHTHGVNRRDASAVLRGLEPWALWKRAVEQVGGTPFDAPAHVLALAFAAGLFVAARLAPASRALLPAALSGGFFLALAADRTNFVVHGLFTASPLLLLALLAPLLAREGSAPPDVAGAWMARSALLFGIAAVLLPVGPGWGWGSRYLLTALPLLVLLAAREVERRRIATERGAGPLFARVAFAAVLAGSVVLQLRGTHVAREALLGWTVRLSEIERSGAEVVVTDDLSVGPSLVPLGLSKAVLYLGRPGRQAAVLERLERDGVHSIGWIGSDAGLSLLGAELAAARPPFARSDEEDVGPVRILARGPARSDRGAPAPPPRGQAGPGV